MNSQGGCWVPRAVAYEHRVAAAIADPGVVDVSTVMTGDLPKALRKHLESATSSTDRSRGASASRRRARFTINFRGQAYGAETPFDTFQPALSFKLETEVISRIRCPMLITNRW